MNENYVHWLEKTSNVDYLYNELDSIRENDDEINDRFYRELAFGTGGLRGVIGAGTNRMNIFTVGRATDGLADYVNSHFDNGSVVIAYDTRNRSREFAARSAEVLAARGIKVYIFKEVTPTPVLSYAVRKLKTSAGIVITASHNPKEYNGYKVYNEKGCQITDVAAKEITSKISEKAYFTEYKEQNELITWIGDEILDSFIAEIYELSLFDKVSENAPKTVYTPLNGTGNIPVRRILEKIGANDLTVVKEQELPDGNFTTCPYPNPEEHAALDLALREGREIGAELVLATDPDADRVGIAVRDNNGEFVLLNGNETGILLMNYMLERKAAANSLGATPSIVKTIVTTDMAFSVAGKYGCEIKEVLTGFKYIGETMDTLDNYVMGLEESYGYLVGKHARDKDAVSAAMMIVEMCSYYKSLGKSLYNVLKELYAEHGYYITDLTSKTYKGESGAEKMKSIIEDVRKNPDIKLLGKSSEFTDFALGVDGLPKSNVLRFKNDLARVLIRPSGTEPKLKIYYQTKGRDEQDAKRLLGELKASIEGILN